MKTRIYWICLCLFLLLGWALEPAFGQTANQSTGQVKEITASALNVRTGPGTTYRILGAVKKGQQYVFSYQRGEETQLLNHLAELAGDSGSELDWFDVAILSHQVGQCMGDHLRNMKKTA